MTKKQSGLICLLLGCTTFCMAGLKAEKIKGNGNVVTRTIQVDDFQTVKLGEQINKQSIGGINWTGKKQKPVFNYTQSAGAATLQITMDENLFPYLEIEQKKGILTIGARDDDFKVFPTRMDIRGSSSRLEKIQVTGCMDFVSESLLQTNSLTISISGVGDAKIDELVCGILDCNLTGVGSLYLSGKADEAEFDVSGVGHVYAFDCVVKNLECDLSGVGSMEVNATEHIKGNVSGVGNMKYKGDAQASTSCSGIGHIKHVEN